MGALRLTTLTISLLLFLATHLAAKKAPLPDGACYNMHCNHIQNVTKKPKTCNRPNHDCVRKTTENGDEVECKLVGRKKSPSPDLNCTSSFFKSCVCDTDEDNSALCVCEMPNGAKISIVLLCLFGIGVLIIFLAAFKWFLGKKHKIEEEMRKRDMLDLSGSGDQRKISSLSEPRPLTVIPERPGEVEGRRPGRVSNAARPGMPVNGHQARPPRVSAAGPGAQPRPGRVSTGYAGGQPRQPRISVAGAGVQPWQPRISNAGAGVQPRQPRISNAGAGVQPRQPHILTTGANMQPRQPRSSTGSEESQSRQPRVSSGSEESQTRGASVSTTDTVL